MKYYHGVCARCSAQVVRTYNLSATRKLRPLYCSATCEALAKKERDISRRQSYFWTKVDKRGELDCWPWRGYRDPKKYGRYGRLLAHRIAFLLTKGPIPHDRVVCHACDNPICVNPAHLWLGTIQDNIADMDKKGRRQLPPVRRGEASNKAKLTAEQALEVFRSNEGLAKLAKKYGITRQSVVLIKKSVNWAHVTRTVQ